MNHSTSTLRHTLLRAALVTAVSQIPANAADRYWDVNGSTTGSGNAGGVWEVGVGNWNVAADGTGSSALFAAGDAAIFSAGIDGTGAFTVNVNGTVPTPSILLQDAGRVTLSGGGIDITGGSTFNTSVLGTAGGASLTWNPVISGNGNLTLAVHGDTSNTGGGSDTIFTLSGTNTFTGDVIITSGVVGYLSNLGNAANKVVLNGGGLVFNNSGTFSRNIEAAGPATLRNYGAATTTHTGVLSGTGSFRRTDGGDFVVTQTATHTGNWEILRGIVTVGNATQTTDLLASSGVITLGDASGAGTLRYRLDSDFIWNTPASELVFANAGGTLAWQANLPSQTLTVANATSFTNSSLGRLFVQNGEIRIAAGADVKVGTLANSNANPANARITVESGATVTTRYLAIGDAGNTAGTYTQNGGTVTVEAGGTGIRLGHWSNGTNPGNVFNLQGGVLDATALAANTGEARWFSVGWDGQGTATIGGTGTLKTAGIRLDRNRAGVGAYASTLTVNPGGTVEVGALGIEGVGTNDGVILAGGTLKATANANWSSLVTASETTNSTIDVDGFIPRFTNAVTGSGTLTVIDSFGGGYLEIDSGTGTRTWSTPLAGTAMLAKAGTGTLVLQGSHTNTGDFLLNAGTLRLSGDIDSALLDVGDGTTLGGEGSTSGDLSLGVAVGANLVFDPTTPGALAVAGDLSLNGVSTLLPTTAFTGTRTVLTYGGSLTGNAANLTIPNQANYRSLAISTAAGSIQVTNTNESLVWTGPGAWDFNTTAGWVDGGLAADNFFFGDNVRFDDTAANTAVNLFGELQPGNIVVDSDTNNFTFSNPGIAQVETATATGAAASAGNVDVTITAAGLTGSPLTISVAVLAGDSDAVWAGKVRTALAANANVSALFTVGGTGTAIVLTRRADANGRFVANDPSLNIAIANGSPTAGITPAATSADTTAGYPTSYLSGVANLLKQGASTLTINAPNTYTGGTVISEGAINVRNAAALGSGTVTLGDANTGTANVALYLDTNRVNFGTPVVISNNGTGTATLGSRSNIGGAADNNQFTNITLQKAVVFDSNAADRTDYENITGSGNITVQGTNRSVFPTDGAAWTGDLTVSTTGANGSLQIGVASTAGNRIPDTTNVTVTAGGLLRLSTTAETIAGLFGAGTVNTNAPSGGTGTLTVGFGGADGNFSGLLTGGPNILALTKTGAGTQIISGNSTYTGITTLSGGTLQVGDGGASGDLGTGAVGLAAGTTLSYLRTGAVVQEGALNSATTGAGTLNIGGDATTAVTLNAGGNFSGVINVNQGTLVFAATNPTATAAAAPTINLAAGTVLTNTGASTHAHLGAVNLTGGSTLTTGTGTGSYNTENYQLNGNVIVSGGTTAATITREASRTNPNSGIALRGTRTFTVADVTGSAAADLVVSTELEPSDNNAGAEQGALIKAGPGTLQFSGLIAHSYTGTTTVDAGTLAADGSIAGPLAVGSAATIAPGPAAATVAAGATVIDGTYACDIDGLSADRLNIAGNLTLGGTSTLALGALGGGVTEATYVIATYTGSRTGSFATVTGLPTGYSVVYNDALQQIELVQTGGDPYGAWETANGIEGAGPETDSDGDGIPNGIEFVIGGDPSGPASGSNDKLPTISTDATYLNFVFRRTDDSAGFDPYVEYGSTLSGWTEAEAGLDGVLISEDADFFAAGIDRVTVRIPRALATGSKLFARLRVDIP
jgi:autotransporter-associated beta strand protein